MACAVHRPADVQALAELVAATAAQGGALEIRGGGSRAETGAPRQAAILDMTAFQGVFDYDPAELVITVGAGTPLAEVEAAVAERGQMLAFDPFDHGPIHGRPAGASTIGGVVAAGVSGSRRVSAGAARDHLLAFKGVSGRGEALIGGAKVVKNVTGYDLPKLAAGSWGRLVALTEVTLKVLPRPFMRQTLFVEGLAPGEAVAAVSRALGSRADVAAAAHDPQRGLTGFRLEGVPPSVAARQTLLRELLGAWGPAGAMEEAEADAFWSRLRTLEPLDPALPLWRLVLPASRSAAVLEELEDGEGSWLMDWGGGLVWLATPEDPAALRSVVASAGGHAMLARAPEAMRAAVPAFHPQPGAVAALEARVRAAFDPKGVFETGRFLDHSDAD